jgi:hypothetical protein
MPMECGFLRHPTTRLGNDGTPRTAHPRALVRLRQCASGEIYRVQNFLPQKASRPRQTGRRGEKRANQCRLIRPVAGTNDLFGARREASLAPGRPNFALAFRIARRLRQEFCARAKTARGCSGAELLVQEIVDGLRVCLAARRLHHLADEPADRLRILPGVSDLVGILGDDVVDQRLDGRNIG